MITISKWLTAVALLSGPVAADAAYEQIDFTAGVTGISGVPNAGTVISGVITFDPSSAVLSPASGSNYAYYSFSAPATFKMTTNGGFSLTQTLTAFNVADGGSIGQEYWVFDADVGTVNQTTFSRLELTFSNNTPTGVISNLNFPQSINLAEFQFKTSLYDVFSPQDVLTNQLVGNVNAVSISPVPLPASAWLMLSALAGIGVSARKRRMFT